MNERPYTPEEVQKIHERANKMVQSVGQFVKEKLREPAQRPFSLAPKVANKLEEYDPALLFPPAIMERAGALASRLFEVFDPTQELRGRANMLESEVPLLMFFHRTLSSLLALSWYATARGWDNEMLQMLSNEPESGPNITKATTNHVTPIEDMFSWGK